MADDATTDPNPHLHKDPAWWISVALTLLSIAASYYGVPIGDTDVQNIVHALSEGLIGLGTAIAAIRALAMRKRVQAIRAAAAAAAPIEKRTPPNG